MATRVRIVPGYGCGWVKRSGELVDVPAPFDLDVEPIEPGSTGLVGHLAPTVDHPLSGMWVSLTPRHAPADGHMNLTATFTHPLQTSTFRGADDLREITGFAQAHGPSVDSPGASPDNPSF